MTNYLCNLALKRKTLSERRIPQPLSDLLCLLLLKIITSLSLYRAICKPLRATLKSPPRCPPAANSSSAPITRNPNFSRNTSADSYIGSLISLTSKSEIRCFQSPVYVLLNPSFNPAQKDLLVTIYESELHVIDGIPQLIFVRSSYTIETVEAERISVDHVAHLKPSDGGSAATQLAAHLTGIHSAIKMLNSRIRVLHQYLLAMQKGDIPWRMLC